MPSRKDLKFRSVPTKDPGDEDHTRRETDPDFMCGVFGCRPLWLQRFAKAYYFLLFYTLFGIFQGALKAYLNGCISTLEKKFGLTGKTFGVILIADNISALFASLLIGYYATKISRPKIIAFGVWISVLGCFCSVLPYLIYGPGFIGRGEVASGAKPEASLRSSRAQLSFCKEAEQDVVEAVAASTTRDETPAPTAIVAVCLLFLANFLNGIGGTAFYISGATYTDDNVKKKNSPVYFSLIMSLRLVGPMLGYVSASVCLSIYESPFEKPGINRKHPNWIGAWWLGFVIWGGAMAVMSLPMSLFPKHIRRTSAHATSEDKKTNPKSLGDKIANDAREFKTAVSRLSKNPVLMWKMATLVFIINAIGGYVSMFPKYVENQYRVSASKASLFTGHLMVMWPLVVQLTRHGGLVAGALGCGAGRQVKRSNPGRGDLILDGGENAYGPLGAVPYPLIYTAIFDATCLVWEDRGGHRGNCSFYDVDKLRVVYHAVTILFMTLGLVCQLVMSYYAKRVTNMYGEDEVRQDDASSKPTENGALEMNGVNGVLAGKTTSSSA
ncbi:hypothetical protein HPB51_018767 [Rhipicephalus microplus]|uniref:Solute carrier organic anion transporter family member n=1 Tax=Rhipicephalus microplus TaxID=6941 RepID=A0A9J6DJ59_RHIMP|nr:hypothetical protein HPB51_018767 [Rhipicephalus microplus]